MSALGDEYLQPCSLVAIKCWTSTRRCGRGPLPTILIALRTVFSDCLWTLELSVQKVHKARLFHPSLTGQSHPHQQPLQPRLLLKYPSLRCYTAPSSSPLFEESSFIIAPSKSSISCTLCVSFHTSHVINQIVRPKVSKME